MNKILKEYDDMKEEIRNIKTEIDCYKTMLLHSFKCRKNIETKNPNVGKTKTEE